MYARKQYPSLRKSGPHSTPPHSESSAHWHSLELSRSLQAGAARSSEAPSSNCCLSPGSVAKRGLIQDRFRCKNISARFGEWLAEILCHGAILGWAAEHFESDSPNLAGMFLHNSVYKNCFFIIQHSRNLTVQCLCLIHNLLIFLPPLPPLPS